MNSIRLNYLYLLLNKFIIIASHCITIPYISRVLGPENVGIKSYTMSYSLLFTILATFGLFTLAQREIARNRDKVLDYSTVFWSVLISSFILISSFLLLWFGFVLLVDKYQLYFFILSLSIFASFFDITWFYIGFEFFSKILLRNAVIKFSVLLLIFVFVTSENDLILYLLILCVSDLCGNISLWFNFKKISKIVEFKNINPCPSFYIKESFKYYIPSISLSLSIVIDKIMIGLITNSEFDNGIFEQTANIIIVVVAIVSTLNSVMAPRMSYLFNKGVLDEIEQKVHRSLDFVLFLVYPAIVGLIAVSDNVVLLFLGEKFYDVIDMICMMSPILFFISISNLVCLQYVTPSGRISLTNRIVCLGISFNVLLNLVLIPFFSVSGAIVSSLVSEFIVSILYMYISRKLIRWSLLFKFSFKKIFACVLMFIGIFLFKYLYANIYFVFMQCLLGFFIYFSVLFVMRDSIAIDCFGKFLKILKIRLD
nr:oligosaccharide flippase family protein [Succinimonas amylolytica]